MKILSRVSQSHHNLPSVALSTPFSHGRSTLRLSLNSLFNPISSSSSTKTALPQRKFLPISCIPTSSVGRLRSLSFSGSTMSRPSLTGKASFTTGSSSGSGREILVQHLLVKENDLNLLLDIQQRVVRGEDLSDLAVEYSICPSKEEGGMLGWVKKGQMQVSEFEEAAFSAPLKTIKRCKTKFGWHLLQVLSEREELVLREVQVKELHERLQDPEFVEQAQFIDVREPEEVAKASLPGFQVLPLQQYGKWAPEITTKFDPDKDTYVMCHHGMRSMQVAKWLQTQGFKRVFNVAGGIHAYAVNVDPSIPTY